MWSDVHWNCFSRANYGKCDEAEVKRWDGMGEWVSDERWSRRSPPGCGDALWPTEGRAQPPREGGVVGRTIRCFNAIVSQLWFWPFWVMFLKLWLKVVHIDQRQNMNWPLADNFEAKNVMFLPKKLASNVQSSCIDNSKRQKAELWHYCIKATNSLQ